jgi:hypothetical protein
MPSRIFPPIFKRASAVKKKKGTGENVTNLRLNLLFYGVLHKKWSFQKQVIIEILGGTKISGKLVKPKY